MRFAFLFKMPNYVSNLIIALVASPSRVASDFVHIYQHYGDFKGTFTQFNSCVLILC
jgi:hypothetical protein